MERIDNSQQVKNLKVKKGTILLLQGERNKSINFLHSGLAELLSNSSPVLGFDPGDVIEGSRRVGLVKGETIYGILTMSNHDPHSKSIRALTDCVISVIPMADEDIFTKMMGDIRLNLRILKALVQRLDSGIFILDNYLSMWKNLMSTAGALALAARIAREDIEGSKTLFDGDISFQDFITDIQDKLETAGIKQPADWDPNVFLGKIQKRIGLLEEAEESSVENLIDQKQFLFLKRFLRKEESLLINLFKQDEPMSFYIYQFLNDSLVPIISKNEEMANRVYGMVETLFANDGWIHQVIKGQGFKNKKAAIFNHYLSKYCWKYRKEIMQLLGIDLKSQFPVYSNLLYYSKINPMALEEEIKEETPAAIETGDISIPDEEVPSVPEPVVINIDPGVLSEFKGLTKRILDFAIMGEQFNEEFLKLLSAFKKSTIKFENEPKTNSLKRRLSGLYWKLYQNCFMKVVDTSLTNFIPGIMLHFGILDETLLQPDHLAFLHKAFSQNLCVESPYPIMTLPYFLEKIYKEEANPSISEMGQSFQEVLRKQTRPTKKSSPSDFFEDNVMDRVRFEIEKCISTSFRMIFGSVTTAFPILCSEPMMGSIDKNFLTPANVSENLSFLRERDFSMFYREIVMHLKHGSDIVKQEVLPYMVMYPMYGTKMIMWQELDGPKRNTPGRLFMPAVFNGDIQKTLLTAIGNFRWELQRLMAGASWMDPVNGGLTGAYYDYITFYKKNPNLTPVVKDKLKEFVKKTRSDKDRFTFDYIMWVLNEFEGIPKLNNVSREIFYKFCPFKKDERERLNKRPTFSNLEVKYQNIVKRNILKIDTRIRKYEKSDGSAPQELVDYLNFLKL